MRLHLLLTHNLKAAGSNPAPATNVICRALPDTPGGRFDSTPKAKMPANSPTSSMTRLPSSGISRISVNRVLMASAA